MGYREPRGVRRYGLSLTLAGMFLTSWVGQLLVQIPEYRAEQSEHGQAFDWGGFWVTFWRATLENWQSEFLQLLSFVVLTAYLVHVGSSESKDGQDRIEAKVDRILADLEQGRRP